MSKFRCTVCGYVHEGPTPPERCPRCRMSANKFELVDESAAPAYGSPAATTGFSSSYQRGRSLIGTKTERNLQEAFAGESQARNKYTYFASRARKDGFVQIAAIFE